MESEDETANVVLSGELDWDFRSLALVPIFLELKANIVVLRPLINVTESRGVTERLLSCTPPWDCTQYVMV
jgi:hypothetical protein